MESAPLTQAHDHARAASVATHNAETTVAIDEHALAAGEFAKAAATTGNQEALRTLKLLEQYHNKLSDLLKFPSEHPVPTAAPESEVKTTGEAKVSPSAAVAELRAAKAEPPVLSPTKSATLPRRLPSRDLGSSIASNLASARGIRASNDRRALSPSVSTQQAPGNVEVPTRKGSRSTKLEPRIPEHAAGKPSWVPPVHNHQNKADAQVLTTKASASAEPAATSPTDEGFFKFYSTFENLISKLSAPLAFAGLPLISEESTESAATPALEEPAPGPRKNPRRTPVKRTGSDGTAAPDLAKYISRAALRASQHQTPVNDSFYVVPSTGHTVSYANILAFAEKDKRRLAASMHSENPDLFEDPNLEDEDEFVDAREHNISHSAGFRKILQTARGKGGRNVENVLEELYLDNKNMKSTIDHLCKRLHAFEASAQSSALALQESMRLMRPGSPGKLPTQPTTYVSTASVSAGGSTYNSPFGVIVAGSTEDTLLRKVKELEATLRNRDAEQESLAREVEKLNKVLAKYKERWEKLKDGAKARREASAAGSPAKPGGDAR